MALWGQRELEGRGMKEPDPGLCRGWTAAELGAQAWSGGRCAGVYRQVCTCRGRPLGQAAWSTQQAFALARTPAAIVQRGDTTVPLWGMGIEAETAGLSLLGWG